MEQPFDMGWIRRRPLIPVQPYGPGAGCNGLSVTYFELVNSGNLPVGFSLMLPPTIPIAGI